MLFPVMTGAAALSMRESVLHGCQNQYPANPEAATNEPSATRIQSRRLFARAVPTARRRFLDRAVAQIESPGQHERDRKTDRDQNNEDLLDPFRRMEDRQDCARELHDSRPPQGRRWRRDRRAESSVPERTSSCSPVSRRLDDRRLCSRKCFPSQQASLEVLQCSRGGARSFTQTPQLPLPVPSSSFFRDSPLTTRASLFEKVSKSSSRQMRPRLKRS